jgi:hypothetical protein
VQLLIDGQHVAKLIASPLGDVTETLDPHKLGVTAGQHTVTLDSLLIDETGRFTSQ